MNQNYKPGELLIDFVTVYEITSITLTGAEGQEEAIIHHKPVKGTDKVFTASIPEKNLIKSGLRRLLTKKEVESLMADLKKPLQDYTYDIRQTKEEIYLNLPHKIVPHLKYLWSKGAVLPKTDLDIREDMLNHLCLEISCVTNKSLSAVRSAIEKSLSG